MEKARKEADTKHSIGMRWKTRAEQLIAETNTRTQTLAARDQTISELNAKVESLGQELEGNKTKVTELEQKATEVEKGLQTKESTVQRLQSELSKAQSGGQASQSPAPAAASTEQTAQLVSLNPTATCERVVGVLMTVGRSAIRTGFATTATHPGQI